MTATLALYAGVGLLLVAVGSRLGRSAFLLSAIPPAVSSVWVVTRLGEVIADRVVVESTAWVPQLGLSVDLRLDGLAATMTLIVAVIGVLIMLYGAFYFPPTTYGRGRIAGLLVLFAGSMVGLVQADHLFLLYVCWELTTVTSYLLIGNKHTEAGARAAALHALMATSTGGLAMLGGFVVLGQAAGTYRLTELADAALPASAEVISAVLLILLGAFTKSAQYPFHAWLPGAMVAPTPISAYLHSATMVKAGVYLVAMLAPVFAFSTPVWRPVVLTGGAVTLIAGALRALRQHDLKLLLAFGTVSQLGLMVILFGAGTPAAAMAGWVLLVSHAAFKAALFMVVGILDRSTGTRDIREMPATVGSRWRAVEAATIISVASMAGMPLAVGAIAKEAAYAAFLTAPFPGSPVVLAATVTGSTLTVAYGWRFYWGAFGAPRRRPTQRTTSLPPSWGFVAPAAVLALFSVVLGIVPSLADPYVTAALRSLGSTGPPVHLALWHGVNLPLLLSAVALGGGAVIAASDRKLQPVLATGQRLPNGQLLHLTLLRLLQGGSRRVTAVVQNGSLPVYSAVILTTAAALPTGALVGAWDWPGGPVIGELRDVPVTALLVVSALGAATTRHRFAAAVFLGVAGYAMALLFVLYGAPDLALTQGVVETLTTVIFVLVLRWLPARFQRHPSPRRRIGRVLVAGLLGGAVFVLALLASGVGGPQTVSEEMVTRSVPDGHGRNVVNVILVDFRALDTLGEITVLATASIGAVALARVGVRAAQVRGERPPRPASVRLPRIVFVDVPVRAVFHALLMVSLWLLFAGHNQPGGGFVGGLLAGSAITLRYVAGGMEEVRGLSRFRPWAVLGAGVLLAAGTAAAPLLAGEEVLRVAYGAVPLPVGAEFTLTSALVFDTGVYLTVVGMVLMAFEAFGDEFPLPVR